MALDPWLPVDFVLPDGARSAVATAAGRGWQLVGLRDGRTAILAEQALLDRWMSLGLVAEGRFRRFPFGDRSLASLSVQAAMRASPVDDGRAPASLSEAMAFAAALGATRRLAPDVGLGDALYVESLGRLLPALGDGEPVADELLLGRWLTGGLPVPAIADGRLARVLSWLPAERLHDVLQAAGLPAGAPGVPDGTPPGEGVPSGGRRSAATRPVASPIASGRPFELPGRPALAAFLDEHVVDRVRAPGRYRALGIGFPSAIVLHGPPGCGKTFAVERLVAHLGWPGFHLESASVASPYVHETARQVGALFAQAVKAAPSVLVIDEMEAFLADRELGAGHHRVEEVAEFLRRIPEATAAGVVVIGMTNRIGLIDPAILRRGRFDHIVRVDPASEEEVLELLRDLLAARPCEDGVDPVPVARSLVGRPLSDVAFVVREAARLTARAGAARIAQASLLAAAEAASPRDGEDTGRRKVGFV